MWQFGSSVKRSQTRVCEVERVERSPSPQQARVETMERASDQICSPCDACETTSACVICLMQMDESEPDGSAMLPCEHAGHHECMEKWLTTHDTCPVCRAAVPNEVRSSLCSTPRSVPRSPWERAIADGQMAISLDHMDLETSDGVLSVMTIEAMHAEHILRCSYASEEEKAHAQLVIDQLTELHRVRERQLESKEAARTPCFWLSCG